MKYLNQSEYAKHAGITQQRVSQLIRGGYLKGAIKKFGKRQLIDPEKADVCLAQNVSPIHRQAQKKQTKPTAAEIEAADWNADQPDLEHHFLETLRYLCKLAELDAGAVQVVQPGDGQEGTLLRFREVDGEDDVITSTLCLCHIFEDPDDLEGWSEPGWFFEMNEEARERLKNK